MPDVPAIGLLSRGADISPYLVFGEAATSYTTFVFTYSYPRASALINLRHLIHLIPFREIFTMTRIAKNRQKSAPPRLRLSQESKEYNLPHAEHVEVSDAPENQIEPGLNDPGNSSSKVISPANVISPTNALLNARATIQTLTNSSGRKQSESPRQWPGPMIPSEFSASQQGHEVPNDSCCC